MRRWDLGHCYGEQLEISSGIKYLCPSDRKAGTVQEPEKHMGRWMRMFSVVFCGMGAASNPGVHQEGSEKNKSWESMQLQKE